MKLSDENARTRIEAMEYNIIIIILLTCQMLKMFSFFVFRIYFY